MVKTGAGPTWSVDVISELNKIGVALSAEPNIEKLLELILTKSREITGADAACLYLVEKGAADAGSNRLRLGLAQSDTLGFQELTKPLDGTSIARHVAVTGRTLNAADTDRLPEDSLFQFEASARSTGYRRKSMLVVPMWDHEHAVIGVFQLINKKSDPTAVLGSMEQIEQIVVPFTAADEAVLASLASQAAVAFERAQLLIELRPRVRNEQ